MADFRLATISDHWKVANRRVFPIGIREISISNSYILSNLNLKIDEGVHAICGPNGAGKTSLMRFLFNTTKAEENICGRSRFSIKNDDSAIKSIKVGLNKTTLDLTEDIEHEIDSIFFDPCTSVPIIQNFLNGLPDLEEIIEAYGTIEYESERLTRINFISQHEYKEVTCIEIEEEFQNIPMSVIPFFKVKNRHGVEYTSTTMGLGELSLFYFEWLVEKAIQNNIKILLIEEPESYLPPSVQSRVADLIALIASKHSIQSIISTHSDTIIAKIKRKNIHVIRNTGQSISCDSADKNFHSIRQLGLVASKKGIIFCEDIAAISLAKILISKSNSFVTDNFYYHIAGSNSKIENTISSLPKDIDKFKFFGLFDGDCRDMKKDKIEKKRFGFLPSILSPEAFIRPYFDSLSPLEKSKTFSVSSEQISIAIEHIQGLEDHDYFNEFFDSIEIDRQKAWAILFNDYFNSTSVDNKLISQAISDLDMALS